jgi:hypothetical protein
MLEILNSRDPSTLVVSFAGQATKEDAETLDRNVQVQFKEDEKFNVLAFINEIDGTDLPGIINGFKVDIKRWNQFNQIAIISETELAGNLASFANYLPGIRVKYFKPYEEEDPWNWILTEGD